MADHQESAGSSLFEPGEILYVVFRRKWIVLAFAALGFLAALVVYIVTPRVFRSEAALLVRYITDRPALDPQTIGERIIRIDDRGQNIINTEIAVLTSAGLVDRVVEAVGAAKIAGPVRAQNKGLPGFLSRMLQNAGLRLPGIALDRVAADDTVMAAGHIMRRLGVVSEAKSSVIRLSYDGPSPEVAQEVLQKFVEAYLKRHSEIHRSAGTFEFLSQQTDQYRSRLGQTEEQLGKLKGEFGVAALDQSKALVATRIENLQAALNEADFTLAGSRAKLKFLNETLAATGDAKPSPAITMPSAGSPAILDPLTRLRLRQQELLATYTEDSLLVRSVLAQIAELEKLTATNGPVIATAVTNAAEPSLSPETAANPNPAVISEEASVVYVEAKADILKTQLNQALAEAQKLRGVEDQIAQLQRRKEIEENNYRYFAQELEKARIDAALDSEKMSNISIIQPATASASMLRPKLGQNMLVAVLAGLFAGLGLAFFFEKVVDQTMKRASVLETSLRSPVLLSIPHQPNWPRGKALSDGVKPMRLLPAHGKTDTASVTAAHDGLNEYYEALRDRVLGTIKRVPGKAYLLGITGCTVGCGVSTTAAGLGLALARNSDGRVLLLDASSMDHAAVKALWKKGASMAMQDLATDEGGNVSILQPNLFVLSATEVTTETPKTTASRGLDELLAYARESSYGFAIFDLPPVSEISLALRLAGQLDGVILLVESGKVHKKAAGHARKLLEQAHATLIGTVLTKKRQYVPASLHPDF